MSLLLILVLIPTWAIWRFWPRHALSPARVRELRPASRRDGLSSLAVGWGASAFLHGGVALLGAVWILAGPLKSERSLGDTPYPVLVGTSGSSEPIAGISDRQPEVLRYPPVEPGTEEQDHGSEAPEGLAKVLPVPEPAPSPLPPGVNPERSFGAFSRPWADRTAKLADVSGEGSTGEAEGAGAARSDEPSGKAAQARSPDRGGDRVGDGVSPVATIVHAPRSPLQALLAERHRFRGVLGAPGSVLAAQASQRPGGPAAWTGPARLRVGVAWVGGPLRETLSDRPGTALAGSLFRIRSRMPAPPGLFGALLRPARHDAAPPAPGVAPLVTNPSSINGTVIRTPSSGINGTLIRPSSSGINGTDLHVRR